MENRINIAELLKDCPKGMELDCTMFDDIYFDYVDRLNIIHCYIQYKTHKTSIIFNQHGTFSSDIKSKCLIFPKGKTTWEGFQRPFKDGDILINGLEDGEYSPFIFKQTNGIGNAQCYCAINCFEALVLNSDNWTPIKGCRLATEEEKQTLFQVIKENGYKWNAETKTLEKLVGPKFKVGDKVLWNYDTKIIRTISKVQSTKSRGYVYWIDCEGCSSGWWNENELTPIPNKFDITTLKPFDKVLVRQDVYGKWGINFFGFYNYDEGYYYTTGNWMYKQCIPYEGNEHLLDTNDDCDNFYKTW